MTLAPAPARDPEQHCQAFPTLDAGELAALAPYASIERYADGDVVFHAGQADIDLFVVVSGALEIVNPTDDDHLITTHVPGEFSGDIDLLTRRPVIVTARARGQTTLHRIPGGRLRG